MLRTGSILCVLLRHLRKFSFLLKRFHCLLSTNKFVKECHSKCLFLFLKSSWFWFQRSLNYRLAKLWQKWRGQRWPLCKWFPNSQSKKRKKISDSYKVMRIPSLICISLTEAIYPSFKLVLERIMTLPYRIRHPIWSQSVRFKKSYDCL